MSVVYDEKLADVYDTVTQARKDYAAEARSLVALVRARCPGATSLLDVACGTGEHLMHLRAEFADIVGVDIAPAMLAAARAKLPDVPLHHADMRTLDLGRRFDVVCCLFSAIGYVGGVDELRAAAARLLAHLEPGGVVIVEPWVTPDDWREGHVNAQSVTGDRRTVLRMSHSRSTGRVSHVDMHYLVGDADGVRYFLDKHELTLFTRDEYLDAFAGARPEWIDGGPTGRGLLVAQP
jgi:SAM-dependent methyltransferase